MVLDPAQSPALVTSPTPPALREKVRVRFRKGGDLRLVSHHDLMKCFERMFRRAALPVANTRGFNPRPRLVFPLSLALGIVGLQEVVEIQLDAPLTPEAVHEALAGQAPPGLTILSVCRIDPRLGGQPRRVCYRVALPAESFPDLPQRITDLLTSTECWVERTRPQPRRLNLRPFLRDIRLIADPAQAPASRGLTPPEGGDPTPPGAHAPGSPRSALEMDLWVTPTGMARPEEVLNLLGLSPLLDTGAVLERTLLELYDESPNPGPAPPDVAGPGQAEGPAEEGPPPAALLPGPLSFDS
jgi:radical SAM-linked protein